jgi:hypothetical protein
MDHYKFSQYQKTDPVIPYADLFHTYLRRENETQERKATGEEPSNPVPDAPEDGFHWK